MTGWPSGHVDQVANLHGEDQPECDGCDQDPWTRPVHYGSCPLAPGNR
jgi:hypothetical protein